MAPIKKNTTHRGFLLHPARLERAREAGDAPKRWWEIRQTKTQMFKEGDVTYLLVPDTDRKVFTAVAKGTFNNVIQIDPGDVHGHADKHFMTSAAVTELVGKITKKKGKVFVWEITNIQFLAAGTPNTIVTFNRYMHSLDRIGFVFDDDVGNDGSLFQDAQHAANINTNNTAGGSSNHEPHPAGSDTAAASSSGASAPQLPQPQPSDDAGPAPIDAATSPPASSGCPDVPPEASEECIQQVAAQGSTPTTPQPLPEAANTASTTATTEVVINHPVNTLNPEQLPTDASRQAVPAGEVGEEPLQAIAADSSAIASPQQAAPDAVQAEAIAEASKQTHRQTGLSQHSTASTATAAATHQSGASPAEDPDPQPAQQADPVDAALQLAGPASSSHSQTSPLQADAAAATDGLERTPFMPRGVERRNKTLNLADAYMHVHDCLTRIEEAEGEDGLHRIADKLDDDSISTAYSGIGAPEVIGNWMAEELQKRLPERKIMRPKIGHQIEWDKHCQEELLCLGNDHNACLFGDISQFYADFLQPAIAGFKRDASAALETLAPVIASGRATKLVGDCLRHGRKCRLRACRRHVAGPSCIAFSTIGARKGSSDVTILYFLIWIALRLALMEPIITKENVKQFPIPLISRFLLKYYFIDSVDMDPFQFGFPSARSRRYIKMVHRDKALPDISPLSTFAKAFHRAVMFSFKEYFFLHKLASTAGVVDDELQKELELAQRRPSSKSSGSVAESKSILTKHKSTNTIL